MYDDAAIVICSSLCNAILLRWRISLLSASSSWEIYREITNSPKTLSAHAARFGLVRTVVRLKLAHVGWERARIRLEWVKRGLGARRRFPRGTSLPYPGLSSVALIYVLVSDVTRVRPPYSRSVIPLVCAQRILRHIIPGVAYINDRNWDLLCLSSAREILRWFIIFAFGLASSFLGRSHLIVKYFCDL